jgi:hypothetical protein
MDLLDVFLPESRGSAGDHQIKERGLLVACLSVKRIHEHLYGELPSV